LPVLLRHKIIRSPASPPKTGRVLRSKLLRVNTLACSAQAQGLYRVADPTLDRYEVYRGIDASPDFTAAPFATNSTLPITTAALSVSHKHHLVLRKRNKWGLISQNTQETIFDVNAGGTLNATPPSDPTNIAATGAAAGTVIISAQYAPNDDGDNAADTWLVYFTTNGIDPNPGTDIPVVIVMNLSDGSARLSYTTAAQAEGTLVKAIVRTRRTGTPNVDSTGSTIVSATATLLGPGAPALQADVLSALAAQKQ
jgi:hypothetical protein